MNQYYVAKTIQDVEMILKGMIQRKGDFAFDVETTSLNQREGIILGIGFSWKPHTGVYIPLNVRKVGLIVGELECFWGLEDQSVIYELFGVLFSDSVMVKVAHNASFDIKWIKEKFQVEPTNTFCTFWYRFIQHPDTSGGYEQRLSLGHIVVEKYPDLIHLKDIWEGIKKSKDGSKDLSMYRSTDKIGEYCVGDCDATFREYLADKEDLVGKPFEKTFPTRLMPAVHFVTEMSTNGFLVDRDKLSDNRRKLKVELAQVLERIQEFTKDRRFDPNKRAYLESLFFKKLGLPRVKVDKKNSKTNKLEARLSLDDSVLTKYKEQHGANIAGDILDYRRIAKLISTYIDGVEREIDPRTGRVHPDLKLWGTVTGRLSCSEPNLQNLPSRNKQSRIIKEMFIAAPGCKLIGADYSQIELRLMAYYTQDPLMLKAYKDGIDLHAQTASILFSVLIEQVTEFQRFVGKTANFALMYLGGAGVLIYGDSGIGNKIMGPEYAEKIDIPFEDIMSISIPQELLMERAREIRGEYLSGYGQVAPYARREIKKARDQGFVTTDYGRVRYLPGINDENNKTREHWERCAVNTRPQGTASDYLMFHFMDMMKEFKRMGYKARQQLMVHDQLVMEVEEDYVDPIMALIPELGTRQDEANINIPMKLEPLVGNNLREVS